MNIIFKLLSQAQSVGIIGGIIHNPKRGYRKHHPLGSTYSPAKVLVLNGRRMSVGQARQYIAARAK